MKKIVFQQVLPRVFAAEPPQTSDVWQREVLLERGRCYLLEAESGSGKSTFCSYVMGYRDDYTGSLSFDDTDVRRLSVADWSRVRQRHVSCLFQELRLFPELTAYENVEIKNVLTRHKTRQQIEAWFERLGIAGKRDTLVARLSFGQQQRVALMRALAQPFDFLLADEPVSHLDDANAEAMAALLRDEAASQGAAVVVTSIGRRLPMEYDQILRL